MVANITDDSFDFNPRAREGRDGVIGQAVAWPYTISIHAPVKGATDHPDIPYASAEISIHAPVKGATVAIVRCGRIKMISIHAPVKGATLLQLSNGAVYDEFQSTRS